MTDPWTNDDLAENWRNQQRTKIRNERIFWYSAFIVTVITMIVLWPKLSRADEIEFNGRPEPAECTTYTSAPTDIEVCVSESFLCRIQGGDIECETKR